MSGRLTSIKNANPLAVSQPSRWQNFRNPRFYKGFNSYLKQNSCQFFGFFTKTQNYWHGYCFNVRNG